MDEEILFRHRGYFVRHWKPEDRDAAAGVIRQCLEAYGFTFEPKGTHLDAVMVEEYYMKERRGEFWVILDEATGKLVGTSAYYEIDTGTEPKKCAEIRKMYLLPEARRKKLGRSLLEIGGSDSIHYQRIIVKTATVLYEACQLYQSAGYHPMEGRTEKCDKILYKDLSF